MAMQWIFVLIYCITSSVEFLLSIKKNEILMIVTASLLSSFAFIMLYPIINIYAMIVTIIVFRFIILIFQCFFKKGLVVFYHTITIGTIDMGLMPFLKMALPLEYVLIAYLILFCLLSLTSLFKHRAESIEWLATTFIKERFIPLLLPSISYIVNLLAILYHDSTTYSILLFSSLSLLLTIIIVILQEFIITCFRLQELNHTMELWQNDAKEYMNTIRSQRHDFNIHLHAISGLISANDYDECKEYVHKIVEKADNTNELMPIYDAVIGSMMADMKKQARSKGTEVHYDIKYDMKNIACSAYECNQIIGNLIQNAIDATLSQEEKEYGIQVNISKRNGYTIISVENKCEKDQAELENIFNLGYTSKKGHEGLGLAMVDKTLKRYSGKIYMHLEHDIVQFIVRIPNKIETGES